MPCHSEFSFLSYEEVCKRDEFRNSNQEIVASKIFNNLQNQFNESVKNIDYLNSCIQLYKKELNFVTDFLCNCMNKLEKIEDINNLTIEHRDWWNKHKKFDEDRKSHE